MKTVGQILRETRESVPYTLEQVEERTKIRREQLMALENGDWNALPPATFIQGFIKNYGSFLKLDTEKLLAIFRRDFELVKHPPRVMASLATPIKSNRFALTPQRIFISIIGLLILSFFGYLWIEYHQFVGNPTLTISSPVDGAAVEIPQVVVEGNTDPEVRVSVNNQEVGVDQVGHFRENVKLSSSSNKILITATSKYGKVSTVSRNVFLKIN